MLRAAICDDESVILSMMKSSIEKTFLQEKFDCSIQAFSSGEELLKIHKDQPYDVLFLDIYMTGYSGFDVAKTVGKLTPNTLLIFVTSQDSMVYNSLDYRPFQFVRKNRIQTDNSELVTVTRKLIKYYREHKSITLYLGVGEKRCVSFQEISYLKSSLHYIEYHLTNGEVLRVRQKITDAENKLNSYGFAKIHRQYIVNLNAIERISTTNSFLRLHSGKTLNISKTYMNSLMHKYQQQMRNMP